MKVQSRGAQFQAIWSPGRLNLVWWYPIFSA